MRLPSVLASLGLVVLLAAWPLQAAAPASRSFDPVHTRLGFELRTRWGQRLVGVFPRFDGGVSVLPDGRHQVTLRMHTRDVQILDFPRYTEWARSAKFFEVDRYPLVVFVSKPYAPQLLQQGGELAGDLMIRGINRPRSLTVEPSACSRAGVDCDVVASGAVRRSDYDMDDWKLAINDRVVFLLRARLQDEIIK